MLCHKAVVGAAVVSVFIFGARLEARGVVDRKRSDEGAGSDAPRTFRDRVRPGKSGSCGHGQVVEIPEGERDGPILRLGHQRGAAGAADPALLYDNDAPSYMHLRIPDGSSPPYWLADDIRLALPNGADEWEITTYGYLTYAFDRTAPYNVTSGLYRFDACTSEPVPLIDWYTGDCCVDPQAIPGTGSEVTIWDNGMVEITCHLPAPVVVDRDIFMYLEYSGANVAHSAGWVVAEEAEIGFTDDVWAEDSGAAGCGFYHLAGDPYSGFRAWVSGTSAAVMDMIPEGASGAHTIVGNEIFLDCVDLPQCVQIAVYARDWDPDEVGVLVKGYQDTINCDSYYTAPAGTLTAVNTDCTPGLPDGCDLCTMGIDQTRPDYIFPLEDWPACNSVDLCPDGVNAAYGCLACALDGYNDDHTPKYMNHYAFEVSADTKGTWVVSLDPERPLTQLKTPNGFSILPLARNPALITVELGRCCYHMGSPSLACADSVTECGCDAMPGETWWVADLTCTGNLDIVCTPCTSASDCDDDSVCTDDSCDLDTSVCSNTPNYDEHSECCDPQTGSVTEIDDGNECTDDMCDPADGSVTHEPAPAGTRCGSPIDTACHNPDTCDGNGSCVEHFEPPTTECRTAADECDVPELCTGSDFDCPVDEFAAPGTPCGDPTDDECTDPDTCDGAGTCLANHEPTGDPCDDGQYCTDDDTCADGICQGDGDPCEPDEWCDEDGDACIPLGQGDFDFDGEMDLTDFAAFQVCFGGSAGGGCEPGDMAGGGVIDLDDYAQFYQAWTGAR